MEKYDEFGSAVVLDEGMRNIAQIKHKATNVWPFLQAANFLPYSLVLGFCNMAAN